MDTNLKDRTSLSIEQIIDLIEFVLSTTYFVYNDTYYQQTHGAAMGSPVSPVVANLYMEEFEEKALTSAPPPHPLQFGLDMWMAHSQSSKKIRLNHSLLTLTAYTLIFSLPSNQNKMKKCLF